MKDIRNPPRLNFYATQAHPCSYLQGQEASTAFADPAFSMNPDVYAQLTELGFRRSGAHIYRPHCQRCAACIPIRVSTSQFKPSRQQKRCWNRNQDLHIEISDDASSGEHYALYERYINVRHPDGDMYPPSRKQYDSFLLPPVFDYDRSITHYIEFRHGHQLLGVAVTDIMSSGLSAIYTYYDPLQAQRSLGVFSVLFQIELAKRLHLPHLYLGYWIKDSPKMSYKSRYRPHELFLSGNWTQAP